MVIKKGTVAIVDYSVYQDESGDPKDDGWITMPPNSQLKSGILMDERKTFRFIFGLKEIHPEIEKALEEAPKVSLRHAGSVFVVELLPGSETPIPMSMDEIFNELVSLKQLGNDALKTGDVLEAYNTYKEAIALMTSPDFNRRTERDIKEVFIPLYLNLALSCLRTNRIAEAISSCDQVLEVDPKNIKALFRRACGRIENHELGPAKRDLLIAQSVDSKNSEVAEKLEVVKKLERKAENYAEKSMYQKMVNNQRSRVRISFLIGNKPGSVVVELFDEVVPRTVENFRKLIDKYAGCSVFKIARDQFFQTGDYEFNDGSGGNASVVDRVIRNRSFMNDENLSHPHDRKGLVGMANYGPDTNTSQFYITLGECPELDGKHVVFGHVVEGIQLLDEINQTAPAEWLDGKRPTSPIIVSRIELV